MDAAWEGEEWRPWGEGEGWRPWGGHSWGEGEWRPWQGSIHGGSGKGEGWRPWRGGGGYGGAHMGECSCNGSCSCSLAAALPAARAGSSPPASADSEGREGQWSASPRRGAHGGRQQGAVRIRYGEREWGLPGTPRWSPSRSPSRTSNSSQNPALAAFSDGCFLFSSKTRFSMSAAFTRVA